MNKFNSIKERREKMILDTIDYKFVDPKLLEQAFTCQSAINNKISSLKESYQKLEFLGDAILKMVVTELIYQIYPNYNEGQLTKIREELEKNKALSIISNKMGLLEFVVRSKSDKFKSKLEADLIEAIIGAIMIDCNYDYKITRYHTLLLISENVVKDIDLELFFEYVSKCKSEIIDLKTIKDDFAHIEQNSKVQNVEKNTNYHEREKEYKFKVNKDEKEFMNSVSSNKPLVIINGEIQGNDSKKILNKKDSNKCIVKEFENINEIKGKNDKDKMFKSDYSMYEDINNYVFD